MLSIDRVRAAEVGNSASPRPTSIDCGAKAPHSGGAKSNGTKDRENDIMSNRLSTGVAPSETAHARVFRLAIVGALAWATILFSPSASRAGDLLYTGVNLAGADFSNTFPGTFGTDYTYPTAAEVNYFVDK